MKILRTVTDAVWNVAAKGNHWMTQPVGQRNQNEYVKEKGKERGGNFKAELQLSKNNSRNLKKSRKLPKLRSEFLINVSLILFKKHESKVTTLLLYIHIQDKSI